MTTSERPTTRHRWWSLVFGVAGVALVPWIVVLAVVQPRVAPVGDLALAAGGAMATTAAIRARTSSGSPARRGTA